VSWYTSRSLAGAEPEPDLDRYGYSVYYRTDLDTLVDVSNAYYFDKDLFVYIGEL